VASNLGVRDDAKLSKDYLRPQIAPWFQSSRARSSFLCFSQNLFCAAVLHCHPSAQLAYVRIRIVDYIMLNSKNGLVIRRWGERGVRPSWPTKHSAVLAGALHQTYLSLLCILKSMGMSCLAKAHVGCLFNKLNNCSPPWTCAEKTVEAFGHCCPKQKSGAGMARNRV